MTNEELRRYVEILERGGVVACPTETFVGLLADALSPEAVDRVRRIKGRGHDAPIAVLVPDANGVGAVATHFPEQAYDLTEAWWPGPLTVLCPARDDLPSPLVKDGKVGVRVPGPSPALELVRAFDGPLTATSANRSGQPPARTSEEAETALGDEVDAFVPGESPGDEASTVVDATVSPMEVIREGAVLIAPPTDAGEG